MNLTFNSKVSYTKYNSRIFTRLPKLSFLSFKKTKFKSSKLTNIDTKGHRSAEFIKRFLTIIKNNGDYIDKYMEDYLYFVNVLGKFIGDRIVLYFNDDEERAKYPNDDLHYQRIVIDFLSTLTDNFVFQAC